MSYNNLNLCKTDSPDHGCTIEDLSTYNGYGTAGSGETYSYWTSTLIGNAGSGYFVWTVGRKGNLSYDGASGKNNGVLPVITISKFKIS